MPAGSPGKEQFRRVITEFRNLHILAALGPLFDFRSEVVANDEFGVRGGLDETTKDHYVEHLLACDRMRRRVTYNPEKTPLGDLIERAVNSNETLMGSTGAVRRRRNPGGARRPGRDAVGRRRHGPQHPAGEPAQLPQPERAGAAGRHRPRGRQLDAARKPLPHVASSTSRTRCECTAATCRCWVADWSTPASVQLTRPSMPIDVGIAPGLAPPRVHDRARLVEPRPGRHLREPAVGEPADALQRAPATAPIHTGIGRCTGSGAEPGAGHRLESAVERDRRARSTAGAAASICSSSRWPRFVKSLPERLVLDRVPAEPDAEPEPAAGEQVDLGGLLGHERGLALRQDDDAGDQLERRHRGQVAEHHERLVERRRARCTDPPSPGGPSGSAPSTWS